MAEQDTHSSKIGRRLSSMRSSSLSELVSSSVSGWEFLAESYPPLRAYWPNLRSVSGPQTAFLILNDEEVFYGGAAGGGKSDALLAAALEYVDVPGYAALILRRSFTDLSLPGAAMSRSKQWLGGKAVWNEREKTWTFPSGATLTFGYVEREDDVYRYQSAEFQYIGFDELTQFSEAQYTYLFSRLRRTIDIPVPPRMRGASNPGNVGHTWVKKRFVDPRPDAPPFIPSKVADNPGLVVDEYRRSLSHLGDVLREQLLDGNWGAFEGMAFSKFGEANIVKSFPLSSGHSRIEAMDYGLNGTAWALVPTDFDGNVVFYDTLGAHDLLPDEVCELVIARRKSGWGFENTVWADPSLFHRTYGRGRFGQPTTLDLEFQESGVPIVRANNDPRAGLIRLRDLIEPDEKHKFPEWHPRAGELGSPRLFVVSHNTELIDALAGAPLQPIDKADGGEKINPEWEGRDRLGHFTAMARYGVMSRPGASMPAGEQEPDDPRAALLWRHRQRVEKRRPFDRSRYAF